MSNAEASTLLGKIKPRRHFDDAHIGYMESDADWAKNNIDVLVQIMEIATGAGAK